MTEKTVFLDKEPKVLLVDDEPKVLAGYKRNLRKQFTIEVAESGKQALEVIDGKGPFAVIVSDMRMPGMDGIQFLAEVKERAPDSVRMMLTGNADQQTAIEAVNEGNIFRFLTKPCPPETLAKSLKAGIKQYRLIIAEQQLLKDTLAGSVKVLTEILGMVNPAAFSRGSRIRRYVKSIAARMLLSNQWQFELAAMLSQIGCVTLPPEICDKVYAGEPLSDDELRIFSTHPSAGHKLLSNIPRLEPVAQMIKEQQQRFVRADNMMPKSTQEQMIILGADILKVTLDFDRLVAGGLSHKAALSKLRGRPGIYNPTVLEVLEKLQMDEVDVETRIEDIGVSELKAGMVADEDIWSKEGTLLVPKGQEVTHPLLARLRNFSKGPDIETGVAEPFRVRVVSR